MPLWPSEDRRHARLVLRVRDGDTRAFRRLYGDLYPPVEAYIGRRVADEASRDDLVAACFERVLDRLDQFDPDRGSLRMWVFGIARNLVADHHRARGRVELHDPVIFDRLDARADAGDDPLVQLLRDERLEQLAQAVHELGQAQRELVTLRYGDGLTHRQIATLLGLEPATVRKRLSRTIKELERRLSPAAATDTPGATDYAS